MRHTRIGKFPIGFRRGWGAWQRDMSRLIAFVREEDFAFVDFGPLPGAELEPVRAAGVEIGSVDLLRWAELVSPDPGRRREAVDANVELVRGAAAVGVRLFLAAATPEDPARPRVENFAFAVDAYTRLCQAITPTGARIVLEGWPGKPPHYATLACTPADLRAFLAAVASPQLGVNFDPSHLARMGIDPLKFLGEFGPRLWHVHAKDVAMLTDELYAHGNLQPATFAPPRAFGGHHWRYALPGHGVLPWRDILRSLEALGYAGKISIELEDEHYRGTDDGERRGLIEAARFLETV